MVRCPTGNRCGLWVQARSLWTGRRCPPFARRILLNRCRPPSAGLTSSRSEEHTSELQSRLHLVCRLLLEKKKTATILRNHFLHAPLVQIRLHIYARQTATSTYLTSTRPPISLRTHVHTSAVCITWHPRHR